MSVLDQTLENIMNLTFVSHRCVKCFCHVSEDTYWFCSKCIKKIKTNLENLTKENLTVKELSEKLEIQTCTLLQILWDIKENNPTNNTIISNELLKKITVELLKEPEYL